MVNVRPRLLLIDDDVELADLLTDFLAGHGFDLDAAQTGEDGLVRALSGEYALVVLDVMLPGIDGFEVLRRIRAGGLMPVIMLTARGEDVDRIVGLELGADDYIPKPFNPRELSARIHAILRRVGASADGAPANAEARWLRVGEVELDTGRREVYQNGQRVELTGVEFDLLDTLLRSAGTVVQRASLFRKVLDREPDPLDRSIDMHVSHLRKKLGREHGGVERIKSIRGVGYVYTRVEDEA